MQLLLQRDTVATWLEPTLSLPTDLLAISASVVALPLRVRGGNTADRFTQRLCAVIEALMARGVSVVVAKGPHPNPLADVGIAVRGEAGARPRSASVCCVLAAERLARMPFHELMLESTDG